MITIPGLLVIGFYGSFADRYGLKRTLIVPVLGNFIYSGCIFLSMQQFMAPYYVPVLLFGSICSGLSGGDIFDLFSLSLSVSSFSVSLSIFIRPLIPHFVSLFLTDYLGHIIFSASYIRIKEYFHNGFFYICRWDFFSVWKKRSFQCYRVSHISRKNYWYLITINFSSIF